MPRSILPNGYYYTFLAFDIVFPALFGTMTLLNPWEAYTGALPLGWDKAGDALVGIQSPRVALTALLGAIMGPVWAIMTGLLLPLAKNGMNDRPDLAEKVVRAHLLSGAIVDPFHFLALLYYIPNDLLFSPSQWGPMISLGWVWIGIAAGSKILWCAGYGRATAKELQLKDKSK